MAHLLAMDRFFQAFQCRYPEAFAVSYESQEAQEPIEFNGELTLTGQSLVSCSPVHLAHGTQLVLTGPEEEGCLTAGSSLLLGRSISLCASEIQIEGQDDHRVVIVGLEGVSIHASIEARIAHLAIYLLKDAPLVLSLQTFSLFKDVHVYRLQIEDNSFNIISECYWKTCDEFQKAEAYRSQETTCH